MITYKFGYPDAPWNREEILKKEIEVTVSVTLSKTVKIRYLIMRL